MRGRKEVGEAGEIFDEVEKDGTKIVVKNNKPACILVSPSQYEEMMEVIEDFYSLLEVEKRMISSDFCVFGQPLHYRQELPALSRRILGINIIRQVMDSWEKKPCQPDKETHWNQVLERGVRCSILQFT